MDLHTVLTLAQLAAYVISITVFIVMMKADVKIVKHDITVMQARQDSLSETLKAINSTLTKVAVQDQRLNGIEEDIRELKHGKGFVRGPSGIDREF